MSQESTIDELELTNRSANALKAAGIVTIGELIDFHEAELLRLPGFGRRSLKDVTEELAKTGLHLRLNYERSDPDPLKFWIVARANSRLGGAGYERFATRKKADADAKDKATKFPGVTFVILESIAHVTMPIGTMKIQELERAS